MATFDNIDSSKLTKQQCMEYIHQEIKDLDEDTLIKFGQFVYTENTSFVSEYVDGCRIHLNPLPEELLQKMYQFVKNQVELYDKEMS